MNAYTQTLLILAALSVHAFAYAQQTEMREVQIRETKVASVTLQPRAPRSSDLSFSQRAPAADVQSAQSDESELATQSLQIEMKGHY